MTKRAGAYNGGSTLLSARNLSWFSPKKRKKKKPRPEDIEPERPKRYIGLINRPIAKDRPQLIKASEMSLLKNKKRRE